MDLPDLWFLLIGVLFTGFFFLEGFDFGVGILLPFLGKTESERQQIVSTILPVWDANEVWMITAGGAMFAAFPEWYATLFSGFYLALVLILGGLILRGVALEFRGKENRPGWRRGWDWAAFIGSALPALLWGVAFANLVAGTPIDADFNFTGNLLDLLSPYTLIAGVAGFLMFVLHGAIFLSLRTSGAVRERVERWARPLWIVTVIAAAVLAVANYAYLNIFTDIGVNPGVVPIATAAALLAVGYFIQEKRFGWAFALNGLTIVLAVATFFWFLYPDVMVSSISEANSLTVHNAAASHTTLEVMSVVALILVPIVLLYQGWSYWIWRKRVTADSVLEY